MPGAQGHKSRDIRRCLNRLRRRVDRDRSTKCQVLEFRKIWRRSGRFSDRCPDQPVCLARWRGWNTEIFRRRHVGVRRDKSAFAVRSEAPAMVTARQAVAVDEPVLEPHATMDALVAPDMDFAVAVAPRDTFCVEQPHRHDVAPIEQRGTAHRVPGILWKLIRHYFATWGERRSASCHSGKRIPNTSVGRAGNFAGICSEERFKRETELWRDLKEKPQL